MIEKVSDNKLNIGVLINQIEGRYQSLLLKGLSESANNNNMRFLYFVGKSINDPNKNETLYNSIYNLAKSDKLDGLIAMTGSIGNYITKEDNSDFFSKFTTKPMVTIGSLMKGIPGIITDNVNGEYNLTCHLIKDHGFRNIAYITGPETNIESQDRLEGFLKALSDNKISVNKNLILKGDFTYMSSAELSKKLIKNNAMLCDAVVCANDEMAHGLLEVMNRKGFNSPGDFAIVGFDNIQESHDSSPPLTTINQPLDEQATLACEILKKIIAGENVPSVTKIDTKLITRESCGCNSIRPIKSRLTNISQQLDKTDIIESIINKINPSILNSSEIKDLLPGLIDNIILDIKSLRNYPLFLQALNDWLNMTYHWMNYSETWYNILSYCQSEIMTILDSEKEIKYLNELFQRSFTAVALKNSQRESRKFHNLLGFLTASKDMSMNLISAHNIDDIKDILATNLQRCGIDIAYLVLHKDGPKFDENIDIVNMDFRFDGKSSFYDNLNFDSLEIIPDNFLKSIDTDLFILPLVCQEKNFGYVVLGSLEAELLAYEHISYEIANALNNINKDKELQIIKDELQGSSDNLEDITSLLPMMIIETDLNTRIKNSNDMAGEILNINLEKIKSLRSIIVKDDINKIEPLIWKLNNTNQDLTYPGIRIMSHETKRIIPIAQISGIYNKETNALNGFRWYLFDPLPLITCTVLPDDQFYQDNNISKREKDVIELIIQGSRIRDISQKLFISESTVKGHMTRIYSKFKVPGKADLIKMIQEYQVKKHGYSNYLFSVMNSLLSIEEEPR